MSESEIHVSHVVPFLYRAEREVRTAIGPDGEPWFVLADLCGVLEIKNVSQARKRLDQDEVASTRLAADNRAATGNPTVSIVSEAGMYELVLTSRTPEANNLRRWITHDVLPSIRATGRYLSEEAKEEIAEKAHLVSLSLRAIAARTPSESSSLEALHYTLVDQFLIPQCGKDLFREVQASRTPPA